MRQKSETSQHIDTIKISHKLSFEEFLKSVTSGTQKIIISNSILEYSKNIRLFMLIHLGYIQMFQKSIPIIQQ